MRSTRPPRISSALVTSRHRNPRVLSFVPTADVPCIYRGAVDGHSVRFLRQIDDFAVYIDDPATYRYEKLYDLIDTRLNEPIKRLALLRLYNGTDIELIQTPL
jgi:hypothetical protein